MKNSSDHAHGSKFRGRNSEYFQNFHRRLKELDSSQLCHKFTYECQMVVEGQGCFIQCLTPVVSMGHQCIINEEKMTVGVDFSLIISESVYYKYVYKR